MSAKILLAWVLLVSVATAMPDPSAVLCQHAGYEYTLDETCNEVVDNETVASCDAWDYYNKCYRENYTGNCSLICPEDEPDWGSGPPPEPFENITENQTTGDNETVPDDESDPPPPESILPDIPEESTGIDSSLLWIAIVVLVVIVIALAIALFKIMTKKPKTKTIPVNLDELGELDG